MNEDFLPEVYRETPITEPIEEYQKKFIEPIVHSRDEIQWIIDYIRGTLNEIAFSRSDSQSKEVLETIKTYQEEKEEQLDILRICEINIKKDTNTFLNAIAGSVNYKWDDYNLIKIIGFQSNQIKCSDNLIPLPLQSLNYVLSARYCLLLKCAINAVMLKCKVISLTENDPQEKGQCLKLVLDFLSKISEQIGYQGLTIKELKELIESYPEQRKFKANKQKDLAKWTRSGIAKYCWNNRRTVRERIRDGFKLPNEPTIIKMFNHWNQYLYATPDKKKEMPEFEPYHQYSEILYASQKTVKDWGEHTFAPTFIKKWMARKEEKEEKRRKKRKDGTKRPDALDRLKVGGDDGVKIMDDLVAQNNDVDPAFYFDDPRPKKRRFKSL